MSTPEAKQQDRERGGAARRTYASLVACFGFQLDQQAPEIVVSICPAIERTNWRHVGGGRWNSKEAIYEKVSP